MLLGGKCNRQPFPNSFGEGSFSSKPVITYCTLELVCVCVCVCVCFKLKCWLRAFGEKQMQRDSMKRSSEFSIKKQLVC